MTAATSPYLNRAPRPLCDDCGERPAVEDWAADAQLNLPALWLCGSCADRRRDHAADHAMEG